jgi:hypothetical protein
MTSALVGRIVAGVGIVCGLLAIGLVLVSGAGGGALHYADHGFDVAFVVGLLAYASYLPAEVGQDTAGGLAGTVVFGFYLFVPAALAFDHLGSLGAAGWLGVCTVLIPAGAVIVARTEHAERAPRDLRGLAMLPAIALIAVGIWLPIDSGGASYWDASLSGHALGLLMVIAVVALLGAIVLAPRLPANTLDYIAAATFGLVEAEFVHAAFNNLSALGSGGWLEAAGGLVMFGAVIAGRLGLLARRPPEPAPAL